MFARSPRAATQNWVLSALMGQTAMPRVDIYQVYFSFFFFGGGLGGLDRKANINSWRHVASAEPESAVRRVRRITNLLWSVVRNLRGTDLLPAEFRDLDVKKAGEFGMYPRIIQAKSGVRGEPIPHEVNLLPEDSQLPTAHQELATRLPRPISPADC